MKNQIMADLVASAGLACLAAAGWHVAPAAGLAVIGAALLLIGIHLMRGTRR